MRSGTSLCTSILAKGGVWVGNEYELDWGGLRDPKGIWEHQSFVAVNNSVISFDGGHWVNHKKIDAVLSYRWSSLFQNPVFNDVAITPAKYAIKKLSNGQTLWGWKDPRNALTLPFWVRVLKDRGHTDIRFIWAYRKPGESMKSMRYIGYDGQKHPDMFSKVWHTYNQSLIEYDYESNDVKLAMVNYNQWFSSRQRTIKRLFDYVGIEADNNLVANAGHQIEERLYRIKTKRDKHNELYEKMKELHKRYGI